MAHWLTQAAALLRDTVEIAGRQVLVREPSAPELTAFGEASRDGDKEALAEATAKLLSACVIAEDGSSALSIEDARIVVAGRPGTALPLLNGIISLGQKKVAMPPAA